MWSLKLLFCKFMDNHIAIYVVLLRKMLHLFSLCIIGVILGTSSAIHFDGLNPLRPFSSPAQQTEAVYRLIERLLGSDYRAQFTLTVDSTLSADSDVVIIDRGPNETIKITGPSGVAVAWGVNHFLRNSSKVHISWDGNQLNVPKRLHHPAVRSMHHSIGRFRYYANVCTFSYSFLWWNWTQWEQHLDLLALNGINLPLAHVGQEAIWQRVYKRLGMTPAEIDAYFTGPAFLAWRRMGNLKNFGGPLSAKWHKQQLRLQHKILARMVEFGMIPVLPAFAGHMPDAIERLYPHANITTLRWNNFNCTYTCIRFVDPTDPLFQQIGIMFLREMKTEFGLYHAYSADPFNEMAAKSYQKPYLDAVGKSIYRSMTAVDPDAVWVMQGWMFIVDGSWRKFDSAKSLLTSVPIGKLLVLDLQSEQYPVYKDFESYYGQPFIWNMLGNFGGVQGLFGAVSKINDRLYEASANRSMTLVGVGLTMEGIFQNYALYQFTLDRIWSRRGQKVNQTNWIRHYATERYGAYDEHLQEAWILLWTSAYDQKATTSWLLSDSNRLPNSNLRSSSMTTRPNLKMDTKPRYDIRSVCTAWKYFITRSPLFSNSSLFKLDLVDLTREVLQFISAQYYQNIVNAYTTNDTRSLSAYATKLLKAYDILDIVLQSHEHFLLGRWLEMAKSMGTTDAERLQYEYNMRNQLTLWGPNGEILDYARKEWSGLVAGYYKPRWALFTSMLMDSFKPGEAPFSQAAYNDKVFATVERPFTFRRDAFPVLAVGDSVRIAQATYALYYSECPTTNNW